MRQNDLSIFSPLISPYTVRRPWNLTEIFFRPGRLEVEIGFGLGEVLARRAVERPETNFLGIELHGRRIRKALKRIAQNRLTNMRVIQKDIWGILERFIPPDSIDYLYCLFPCPWPKRAHLRHRLFSQSFLKLLNSRMKTKAAVRIVTDLVLYRDWILQQSPGTGWEIAAKTIPGQEDTKFERKWKETGQKDFYELTLTKTDTCTIPVREDEPLKALSVDHFNPEHFRWVDQTGEVSIIKKDFLFDAQRKKAMVLVLVAEEHLRQLLWIQIHWCKDRWWILPANGNAFIPTAGIGMALEAARQYATASQSRDDHIKEFV